MVLENNPNRIPLKSIATPVAIPIPQKINKYLVELNLKAL